MIQEQLILLEQRLQEWAKQRIDESVAAGAALSAADRASQQQNMVSHAAITMWFSLTVNITVAI